MARLFRRGRLVLSDFLIIMDDKPIPAVNAYVSGSTFVRGFASSQLGAWVVLVNKGRNGMTVCPRGDATGREDRVNRTGESHLARLVQPPGHSAGFGSRCPRLLALKVCHRKRRWH